MIEKKDLDKDLSLYNPPMNWKEFVEEYGIDYTEWMPYAEDLSEESQSLYPWIDFLDNVSGFVTPKISPFNLYFINKHLEPFGLTSKDIFRANAEYFRCDNFTNNHDGLHILFAGCSITFGDGMVEDYIWPRIVYDKIAAEQKTSGYFNIAFPGADHSDILLQIFKYIDKYGTPDIIFINFPDIERQIEHGISLELASRIISTLYMMLEKHCENNGSTLISFTWNDTDNINPEKIFLESWAYKDKPTIDPRLYFGKTYHRFDPLDRQYYLMDYERKNKNHKYADFMFRGLDVVHPGIAEHAFYADLAYKLLRGKSDKEN